MAVCSGFFATYGNVKKICFVCGQNKKSENIFSSVFKEDLWLSPKNKNPQQNVSFS